MQAIVSPGITLWKLLAMLDNAFDLPTKPLKQDDIRANSPFNPNFTHITFIRYMNPESQFHFFSLHTLLAFSPR
jgi:hypothetical protein